MGAAAEGRSLPAVRGLPTSDPLAARRRLPAETYPPEAQARVLALYALRLAVHGHTHDRAAVEAAAALVRQVAPTTDEIETVLRAEAVDVLTRELAHAPQPRLAREQAVALTAVRAAEVVLAATADGPPTVYDRVAATIRRTA